MRVEQPVDASGRMVGQADAADELRSRERLGERSCESRRTRPRDRDPIGLELAQQHIPVDEISQDGRPEERAHGESQERELQRPVPTRVAELVDDDSSSLIGVEAVEECAREHDARPQQAGAERPLPARVEHVDVVLSRGRDGVAIVRLGECDDRERANEPLLAPDGAQPAYERDARRNGRHRDGDEREGKLAQLDGEADTRARKAGADGCDVGDALQADLDQRAEQQCCRGRRQDEKRADDEVRPLAHVLRRAARNFSRRSESSDCRRSSSRAIAIWP